MNVIEDLYTSVFFYSVKQLPEVLRKLWIPNYDLVDFQRTFGMCLICKPATVLLDCGRLSWAYKLTSSVFIVAVIFEIYHCLN